MNDIEEDGWVYVKIVKGMYGLPEAGKIANDLLKKRLDKAGYYPIQFTPGLWIHVGSLAVAHEIGRASCATARAC